VPSRSHIAEQFDEVCVSRVSSDHKGPLSDTVEDRLAASTSAGAGGNDEQLRALAASGFPKIGAAT